MENPFSSIDVSSKKSNLKLILLLLGLFIGSCTVLYTNHLANKMATEEKHKAQLWAEAIARKARLLRYTKELFTKLAADERRKVNVYAQATKFVLTMENNDRNNDQITFFNDIITSNNDIPAILTSDKDEIISARNFDLPGEQKLFQDCLMLLGRSFYNIRLLLLILK